MLFLPLFLNYLLFTDKVYWLNLFVSFRRLTKLLWNPSASLRQIFHRYARLSYEK